MGSRDRLAEYLAKAKDAEEQAAKAMDEATKSSWLRIAAGYHELAGREGPHLKP